MRIALLSLAALSLAGCATGGASGGNRPYRTAPAATAAPAARSYAAPSYAMPAARGGRVGFDAQDVPLETALAGGRASGRPVALWFLASWCGYCAKLERNTLPDASVQAEMAAFYNVRLDPDRAGNKALLSRYGVHGFPSVVFVDSSGERRKGDISGYSEPVNFASRLRQSR